MTLTVQNLITGGTLLVAIAGFWLHISTQLAEVRQWQRSHDLHDTERRLESDQRHRENRERLDKIEDRLLEVEDRLGHMEHKNHAD